jgi:hypothetical protein
MAIYKLLKDSPLEPELIRSLEAAYEKTLRTIGLVDRDDPLTERVGRKIIEIAQTGVIADVPNFIGAPDEMKLRTAISLKLQKIYYAVSGAFARVRSFRN